MKRRISDSPLPDIIISRREDGSIRRFIFRNLPLTDHYLSHHNHCVVNEHPGGDNQITSYHRNYRTF